MKSPDCFYIPKITAICGLFWLLSCRAADSNQRVSDLDLDPEVTMAPSVAIAKETSDVLYLQMEQVARMNRISRRPGLRSKYEGMFVCPPSAFAAICNLKVRLNDNKFSSDLLLSSDLNFFISEQVRILRPDLDSKKTKLMDVTCADFGESLLNVNQTAFQCYLQFPRGLGELRLHGPLALKVFSGIRANKSASVHNKPVPGSVYCSLSPQTFAALCWIRAWYDQVGTERAQELPVQDSMALSEMLLRAHGDMQASLRSNSHVSRGILQNESVKNGGRELFSSREKDPGKGSGPLELAANLLCDVDPNMWKSRGELKVSCRGILVNPARSSSHGPISRINQSLDPALAIDYDTRGHGDKPPFKMLPPKS